MTYKRRRLFLSLAAVAVGSFLALASFGMGMWMDADGSMGTCVFMSDAVSVCPMNALEHFGVWQGFFQLVVKERVVFFAFGLLALWLVFIPTLPHQGEASQPWRFYTWKNNFLRWFSSLLQAFADGILHPKLYA